MLKLSKKALLDGVKRKNQTKKTLSVRLAENYAQKIKSLAEESAASENDILSFILESYLDSVIEEESQAVSAKLTENFKPLN